MARMGGGGNRRSWRWCVWEALTRSQQQPHCAQFTVMSVTSKSMNCAAMLCKGQLRDTHADGDRVEAMEGWGMGW